MEKQLAMKNVTGSATVSEMSATMSESRGFSSSGNWRQE
jgi:hypothetical protein